MTSLTSAGATQLMTAIRNNTLITQHPDATDNERAMAARRVDELRLLFRCSRCLDEGSVCEDHPLFPWEGEVGSLPGHPEHGGAGMPCPNCCSPIPQDGTRSIHEAFVPDWKRGR